MNAVGLRNVAPRGTKRPRSSPARESGIRAAGALSTLRSLGVRQFHADDAKRRPGEQRQRRARRASPMEPEARRDRLIDFGGDLGRSDRPMVGAASQDDQNGQQANHPFHAMAHSFRSGRRDARTCPRLRRALAIAFFGAARPRTRAVTRLLTICLRAPRGPASSSPKPAARRSESRLRRAPWRRCGAAVGDPRRSAPRASRALTRSIAISAARRSLGIDAEARAVKSSRA